MTPRFGTLDFVRRTKLTGIFGLTLIGWWGLSLHPNARCYVMLTKVRVIAAELCFDADRSVDRLKEKGLLRIEGRDALDAKHLGAVKPGDGGFPRLFVFRWVTWNSL